MGIRILAIVAAIVLCGYAYTFSAEVRNGAVAGQHDPKGAPGSATLAGQIAADGAANLRVDGLTGSGATSGGLASGTPYSYANGTATRTEGRPCTFAFSKVGNSPGQSQSAVLADEQPLNRNEFVNRVGKTILFQSVGGKHEITFNPDNTVLDLRNTRGAAGQASRRGTWTASDGRFCLRLNTGSRCCGFGQGRQPANRR